MTEKIINGIPFSFERDENYNGIEYCPDYMFKEDDGVIIIETPRNEETILSKFERGWKPAIKLMPDDLKLDGKLIITERNGKVTIGKASSTEGVDLPRPTCFNDFVRIYLVSKFKTITVNGSCYYDGPDTVDTRTTIEK